MIRQHERGSTSAWTITAIVLMISVALTITATVWALVNYLDLKSTFDSQKNSAVATAKKEQFDEDEARFDKERNSPDYDFFGPEEYGSLTFKYPKSWSLYVNKAGSDSGQAYEAYLNPAEVPPVSDLTQRFALRVKIEQTAYDKVVLTYDQLVKKSELKSSAVTINGQVGTRLEGNFTKDIKGSAVIFRIRDKTVTLRTDASDTFKQEFDAIITSTTYNS